MNIYNILLDNHYPNNLRFVLVYTKAVKDPNISIFLNISVDIESTFLLRYIQYFYMCLLSHILEWLTDKKYAILILFQFIAF